MAAIKAGKMAESGVRVEISDGAREIFANAPLDDQWTEFSKRLSPWQQQWSDSVAIVIRMLNGVRTASPMLPLVRSNTEENNVLFRPSVVQRDLFGDPAAKSPNDVRVRYTIIFVRTPDATMAGQSREDRLYHWLMLARNFREAIIDGYSKKFRSTSVSADTVREVLQDLVDEMTLIRIDSESRGLDLKEDMKLFCQESARALHALSERWVHLDRELETYRAQAFGFCAAPNSNEKIDDQIRALLENFQKTLTSIREINQSFTLHVTSALLSSVANVSS
jgi:hypothetical protein